MVVGWSFGGPRSERARTFRCTEKKTENIRTPLLWVLNKRGNRQMVIAPTSKIGFQGILDMREGIAARLDAGLKVTLHSFTEFSLARDRLMPEMAVCFADGHLWTLVRIRSSARLQSFEAPL